MTDQPNAPDTAHDTALSPALAVAQAAFSQGDVLTTALRNIVDEFGHIDTGLVDGLAQIYNISRAEVHGVISFYSDFRTDKPGQQTIKICQAEACQAVGARSLTAHVENVLGIKLGQTTPDGAFSLEGTFCLGLCATGPAAQKDETLYANLTPSSFEAKVLGKTKEAAE